MARQPPVVSKRTPILSLAKPRGILRELEPAHNTLARGEKQNEHDEQTRVEGETDCIRAP